MASESPTLALAELVARTAHDLGIETAVIGALALAAHNYVRATADVDLATAVPTGDLRSLQQRIEALGYKTELRMPDDEDPLGGVLEVWEHEDDEGDPIHSVEVVNFTNPFRPHPNPGSAAVRNATSIGDESPLRFVSIPDLVALKLYSGGRRDQNDVVELLVRNPDADRERIRSACAPFGLADALEALLVEADRAREADD